MIEKIKDMDISNILLIFIYSAVILVAILLGLYTYKSQYSFYIEVNEITMTLGEKYQVQIIPEKYKEVNYTEYNYKSKNSNIATINKGGYIESSGVGTTEIEITSKKGFSKVKLIVNVLEKEIETITFNGNVTLRQYEIAKCYPIINNDSSIMADLTYKSENEDIVVVDEEGNIKALAHGTTKVYAIAQNGVTGSIEVIVEKETIEATSISVEPTELTLNIGDSKNLKVVIFPEDTTNKSLNYISSNPSIVSIDQNGIIVAKKAGEATIIVKTTNGLSTTSKVIVKEEKKTEEDKKNEPIKVTLNRSSISLKNNETYKLEVTISPDTAENKTVTWISSDTSIASVNDGLVMAKKAGTVTITAKTSTGNTATCRVTVEKENIEIVNVELSQTSTILDIGNSMTLTAIVLPENATDKTVTWTSSDTNIVSVSNNGTITAKKAGTVTITVKTVNGKTKQCKVIVPEKAISAEKITLNKTSAEINVGKTETLIATISPTNTTDKNITWTSSDTSVATVSNGTIIAKKAGTVTITAKTSNGKTANCKLTVKTNEINTKEYLVYVNPNSGNDSNTGSINAPVKTLEKAQTIARKYSSKGDKDVIIYLRAGTYILNNTLTFTSADSGKNGHTVSYTAYNNEKVTISGGKQISAWKLHDSSKNIWVADAKNITSRDFFVNGKRATLARTNSLNVSSINASSVVVADNIMKNLSRPQDVILVINNMWTQSRIAVNSANNGRLTMVNPAWTTYYTTADLGGKAADKSQIKYAENAYEFLDGAGEWYLNKATGKIYYIPRSGENMNSVSAYLGNLEQLIYLKGTKNAPVSNLNFSGLNFSHTTWLQSISSEGLVTIQANHYKKAGTTASTKFVDTNWIVPSAAVYGTITKNVKFNKNTFSNLGNAGIHLAEGTKSASITYNTFKDCAGTGIMLSGFSATYHNSISANGSNINSNWYLVSENNSITDNTITDVASVYNGGVGIEVGYVRNTNVSYNTLKNLPYTAISFGWGWGFNGQEMSGKFYSDSSGVFLYSGNSITYNYIDNIMNILFDGGGIYTLGRNDNSVINNNYIANVNNDYGAIYLDNGSQGFTVTNNAIYNAYRNFIYKGDYNTIKSNYSKIASSPNLEMLEPLDQNNTHTIFTDNEKWSQSAVDSIKAKAGVR